VETALGHRDEAYKAYAHTIRQNPPYELAFNARIAQTEVMGKNRARQMISKLKRMARNDNNKDYLDQVYYAIGNIYLAQNDTTKAIAAYEKGNEKATRSGIEKGVLLLRLGDLYWTLEKYNDAQRCYGAAIGMLDKERPDYEELSQRSKVLDELVPFTDAVYLQDSLQQLAKMDENDRNAAIDRVIDALKKKEKEERDKEQEAEVERQLQKRGAAGNTNMNNRQQNTPATPAVQGNGQWYFYNPQAVSQGKQTFQRQWGKRENQDDWQRMNQTVVGSMPAMENPENPESLANPEFPDSASVGDFPADSLTNIPATEANDSAANDPHKREYYLAQIPFTEEQVAESNNIIKDGLFNSGVIFKDKLDNLRLSEKQLLRLANNYTDFEKMDEVWYHLYLLYSRMGKHETADNCLSHLKADFAESQWTILLSDPYFEENARFGQHIEDSLYAATYEAFKQEQYLEVKGNAHISEERFPLGENRPKFIFINGLTLLNEGDATGCLAEMKQVVEKYPKSEVSEMAGMIVKGVQEGRALHGGKFDLGDVWSRRDITLAADSTSKDTLSAERNTDFLFIIAFEADSVNENQLLFEMARYNFTNFMVRNFELTVEKEGDIHRLLIGGFMNYDEALQYARRLHGDEAMRARLHHTRSIVISQQNLKLIGTRYSYNDYEEFYEKTFMSLSISDEQLLEIPEQTDQPDMEDMPEDMEETDDEDVPDFDDDLF
jgi:tetratricopeptide (TPR) repeat protein